MRALSLLCLACALGCGERPPVPSGAVVPQNVLLITIDTLRADRLGAYGHPRPTSPRLDELARGAVVFDRAYSTSAWTLPAMASLLTALYPSAHGLEDFEAALAPGHETLAELLAAAGFATAGFTSHEIVGGRHGLDQGFHTFDTFSVFEDLPAGVTRKSEAPATVTTAPWVSDRGIAWLESMAASGQRWLLWLHYFDPHTAYVPHEGITEQFTAGGTANPPGTATPPGGASRRRSVEEPYYEGEIRFTDLHVGRVLDAVARLGAQDDTLVIVHADHGEEFLDHGGLGHKKSLYGEVVRVPLLIRAPGAAPGRVDATCSLVDLLPTILDLLELPQGALSMGRSLVPLLRGERLPPRAALLELEMDAPAGRRLEGLVGERFKLVRSATDGDLMLFDLVADPAESRNLVGEAPEAVQAMLAALDRLLAAGRQIEAATGGARIRALDEAERERLRELGYLGGGK